jgi:hypothetical protein
MESVVPDSRPSNVRTISKDSSISTNFCKECRKVLNTPVKLNTELENYQPYQSGKVKHHQSLEAFFGSIQAGCPMCFHMYSRISVLHPWIQQLKIVKWHEKCYLDPNSCKTPNLKGWSMTLQQTWCDPSHSIMYDQRFWVNIFNGDDETELLIGFNMTTTRFSQPDPPLRHDSLNASSTAAVDVRRWLYKCCEEHDCDKDRQKKFLPERLLECNENSVRLIERKLLDGIEDIHYVTLSYCWGQTPQHMTLTSRNYQQLTTTGIPITDLEATFSDATRIVIQLGLKYLWIDALCIVQNSHQQRDWIYHVDQMKDIYGSCFLNIAAAYADNASVGCFSKRPLGATMPVSLPAPVFDGRETPIPEDPSTIRIFPPQFDPLPAFNLNSRGWVFQERLLSPRTVHYDAHEVYWECHALVASGAVPDGPTQLEYRDFASHPERPPFGWRPDGETTENLKLDISHWTNLASTYSKRRLTEKCDRLVAFSAIASKISEAYNEEYVAGIFVSHLPTALMWYMYDYESEVTMDSPIDEISNLGIAPSWSWGSVMTGVSWDGYVTSQNDVLTSVRSIQAESTNTNGGRYNNTKYALALHGPVFRLQIDRILTSEDSEAASSESKCEFIKFNQSICHLERASIHNGLSSSCEPVEQRKYCVKGDRYSQFWLRIDKHRVYLEKESWKSLVFLILTGKSTPKTNGWTEDESGNITLTLSSHGETSSELYHGIALLPLNNAEDDVLEKRYMRVGVFHLVLCSTDNESIGKSPIQHRYDTVVLV